MYHVGIDLHGTLLPDNEEFDEKLTEEVIDAMKSLKGKTKLYVCTGNDLSFVKRKIPEEIVNCFDGFILETGCTFSEGETEQILVGDKYTILIKELEHKLRELEFPEVYKFGDRLATISMFVHYGKSVHDLWHIVSDLLKEWGYAKDFDVLYSSVAVDIRPKGFNKFTGMQTVAQKEKTIGIADSYNDAELLAQCDYAFIPNDTSRSQDLIIALNVANKKIIKLSDNDTLNTSIAFETNAHVTEGVIEALHFLARHS